MLYFIAGELQKTRKGRTRAFKRVLVKTGHYREFVRQMQRQEPGRAWENVDRVSAGFVWHNSQQGHKHWQKVGREIDIY